MPLPAPVTTATLSAMGLLFERGEHVAHRLHDLVDLRLVDDERGSERDDVAGRADEHALFPAAQVEIESARAGGAGARRELHGADEPVVADVDHVLRALERMQRALQ